MGFEVYDIETLSNLFTYTGYDCYQKIWKQFVVSQWRNDFSELVNHLSYLRANKYYQVVRQLSIVTSRNLCVIVRFDVKLVCFRHLCTKSHSPLVFTDMIPTKMSNLKDNCH